MGKTEIQNMPRPGHELPKQEAARQAEIEKASTNWVAAKQR